MKALPRLFVLADSISIGYGPELERLLDGRFTYDRKGYALLATAPLDSPQINGGDSACVLAYLRSAVSELPRASLLLLNCGLHDLRVNPLSRAHQVELPEYTRNLEQILYLAADAGHHLVWVRTTPVADALHNRLSAEYWRYTADIERYNAAADHVMLVNEAPTIDLYRFTLRLAQPPGGLEALYEDHVHFTTDVRRLQAAYIAGWLEAYIHG
ncbi:MAG: SGNH/GDSL hydrolase family protein [Chloroflexota bacterium]